MRYLGFLLMLIGAALGIHAVYLVADHFDLVAELVEYAVAVVYLTIGHVMLKD